MMILICAMLMRLKGYGIPCGKAASSVLFALACGLSLPVPWWQATLAGMGWLAGVAPSIGEEIGAMTRGTIPLSRGWFGEVLYSRLYPWPRLWGIAGCMARGTWMGLCIGLPLLNPWVVPACAVGFPVAYWLAWKIDPADWAVAEWMLGAVIGLTLISGGF